MALQRGRLLFIGKRLYLVDQGLADAGAQVFAKLQPQRRLGAGKQQGQAEKACGVEGAKQRDLGLGRELLHVVNHQKGCLLYTSRCV